jgi:hypothetical protein
MIGLCGAHRTGKSTLAGAFSEEAGVPVLYTKLSGVFANAGLDPKADYKLSLRLDLQRRMLECLERQYRSVDGGIFVTDRTPLDLMAYTLADVQRANVPSELEGVIERYLDDCIDVSNAVFSILVVVQPGIKPVEASGKAPATYAYTEHINSLMMGLAVSEAVQSAHYYIPREMTELKQRVECLSFAVRKTQEKFENAKKAYADAGCPMVFH